MANSIKKIIFEKVKDKFSLKVPSDNLPDNNSQQKIEVAQESINNINQKNVISNYKNESPVLDLTSNHNRKLEELNSEDVNNKNISFDSFKTSHSVRNNNSISRTMTHQLNSGFSQNEINLDTHITRGIIKQTNLPTVLASEIKYEKSKAIILLFMTGFVFLLCITIGVLGILQMKNIIHTNDRFPSVFLMFPIAFLAGIFVFSNIYDLASTIQQANSYIRHSYMKDSRVPYFVIKNFKQYYSRIIIINWIAVPTYIIGLIVIGLMVGLSNKVIYFFAESARVSIPNLTKLEVPIIAGVLGALLLLQIFIIISSKYRRQKLIAYYGYSPVNSHDLELYLKRINRNCLILFLVFIVLLTLLIVIPYLVTRKFRKKK